MGTSIEGVFTLTPPAYSKGPIFGDTEQPKQSIYESSGTQQYALGTPLEYNDGRKFRYAKNGGVALSKALMTAAEANTAQWVEELQSTSGTSVAVGDQEIIVDVTTGSGLTADELAEGWLVVNKATGIGDVYKILACTLPTATTARLLLETPIRTAFAADTEITLLKNRWMDVVVFPTTAAETATGVPLIAVPIGYYFWAQTAGDCPGIVDAGDTLVAGDVVGKPGTHGTAGGFGVPANDDTDSHWGRVRYIATAGEVALIDLHLE